uniref:phosphoadenylyl-sulfate reductase n=1 Tax=Flavobacterium sp. TaxID=239 RepID=UPI00404B75B1
MKLPKEKIAIYNKVMQSMSLEESLHFAINNIAGNKKFSTSFGIEDQVLTHFLSKFQSGIEFFTLDTGRQFNETYEVFQKTQTKYPDLQIQVFSPEEKDLQEYISKNGINGFYDSIESRKKCCFIRKVKPLQRALQNTTLWITGLRAEQSMNREKMQFLEWDESHKLIKFNPLLNFTLAELETIVQKHNIPINSLYHKGFLSIGCAPCTRAIEPQEDFRAGRWWWENGKKECGLHEAIPK